MGESPQSPAMARARAYVVKAGGLEAASTFSRLFLALFGQLSWKSLPWTPLFLVDPANPAFMNVSLFPQWVRPHIVPITYLGSARVQRDLGPRFSLAELHATRQYPPRLDRYHARTPDLNRVVDQMLRSQAPLGSWGGYTSATLFTAAALSDHLVTSRDTRPDARRAMMRGLKFVDDLYVNPANPAAYLGTVCDGRLWDTILVLQGLLTLDPTLPEADAVADYLKKGQVANGGIPFGLDFKSTPDLDDTAEFVTTLALHDARKHASAISRALGLLTTMQNADGGWGAFDHENNGNFILRNLTSGLSDSANLFDPSTPDVTGHVLEAFGAAGYTLANSSTVRRAVEYLRATVEPNGLWSGRWGVNYIYGTNAAVSGLLRVGVSPADPAIVRAVEWIESRQNADGGFGETTRSYLSAEGAVRGVSTPSQTAWALMMFVRTGRAQNEAAKRAVQYLVNVARVEGGWTDPSVVGTGHVGIVYLNYPAYPLAFPMIALAEYLKAVNSVEARVVP